jgi:hypothetical protein
MTMCTMHSVLPIADNDRLSWLSGRLPFKATRGVAIAVITFLERK